MFTQCPQCETIFRLTADALGAAGGQVRCGRCGEVFDALKRLSEEPRMFVIGESTLELESRAEQILAAAAQQPPAIGAILDRDGDSGGGDDVRDGDDDGGDGDDGDDGDDDEGNGAGFEVAGDGIASLEILDLQADAPSTAGEHEPRLEEVEHLADADRSLEFTLAPAELDRIFIEAGAEEPFPGDDDHLLARIRADMHSLDEIAPPDHRNAFDDVRGYDSESIADVPAADAVPRDEPAPEAMLALMPDPTRRLARRWIAAGILLGLALAAQIVHRHREYLASRPPFGPALRTLYATLGRPLPLPASLSGYQLRQWGASGDATASGALRVRASILNTTGQMQPFPLLRVTLADRFGAHLGSREFEPADYLGRPVTRLLGPGERADATVDIQDPGKNAEGFELDVCLRGADSRVHCASDPARSPP